MNSPRYQKQLAEERKALGLEEHAIPQESMFGEDYGDMSGLVGEGAAEGSVGESAGKSAGGPVGKSVGKSAAATPVEVQVEAEEVEVEEVEVVKTPAQLLMEKIERSKGLRK